MANAAAAVGVESQEDEDAVDRYVDADRLRIERFEEPDERESQRRERGYI